MNLLEQLARSVAEQFPNDPSAPSVLVSLLPSGEWYASVVRYTKTFGEGKLILAKVKDTSLEGAITRLGRAFLVAIGRGGEVNKLIEMLNGN